MKLHTTLPTNFPFFCHKGCMFSYTQYTKRRLMIIYCTHACIQHSITTPNYKSVHVQNQKNKQNHNKKIIQQKSLTRQLFAQLILVLFLSVEGIVTRLNPTCDEQPAQDNHEQSHNYRGGQEGYYDTHGNVNTIHIATGCGTLGTA